jgi:hypothetical protein
MPVISAPVDAHAALRPTGLVVPSVGLRADHLDDLATDPAGAAVPSTAGPAPTSTTSWSSPRPADQGGS